MQRSIIPKYVSKAMIKTTEAKFIYSHLIYPPPKMLQYLQSFMLTLPIYLLNKCTQHFNSIELQFFPYQLAFQKYKL